MNRGLIRGVPGSPQHEWVPPIGSDSATLVSLGSGYAYGSYSVVQGSDGLWCTGQNLWVWGSGGSGGGGTQYAFGLPLPARRGFAGQVALGASGAGADYMLGTGIAGQIFGTNDTVFGAYTFGESNPPSGATFNLFGQAPAWAQGVVGHFSEAGTLSMATNGGTTKVVNHNMATAPDSIVITPNTSPASSTVTSWWVTTITATQFTVNVNAQPTTNAMGFNFVAVCRSNQLGPKYPYAYGSNGDHMEFNYAYPIA